MKSVSIEQLWQVYPNKYLALNIAALEVRRLIDAISRDEIRLPTNPYEYALYRLLRGELKHAPLTEAELEALTSLRTGSESKRSEPVAPGATVKKSQPGDKTTAGRQRS
ncbi:MAG: hypothetical protein ACP5JB_05915 [candidate division WOR-3 bacterium]|jgi:hypothetical protein